MERRMGGREEEKEKEEAKRNGFCLFLLEE